MDTYSFYQFCSSPELWLIQWQMTPELGMCAGIRQMARNPAQGPDRIHSAWVYSKRSHRSPWV